MPNITTHVCRQTHCSNPVGARMNLKTLQFQYLMGCCVPFWHALSTDRVGRREHSAMIVTMNVYTHLGLEDAAAEMARMKVVEEVWQEQEKVSGETGSREMTQKMFRVI